MQELDNTEGIQSVEKALDILEFLSSNEKEASITDIKNGTGLSASTIHRQLGTLRKRGYVYQNDKNQKYYLGFKLTVLGNVAANWSKYIDRLYVPADELARKYGLSVYIAVPNYSSAEMAMQTIVFRSNYMVSPPAGDNDVGTVIASHSSATGKCLMAYYPENLMNRYIEYPLHKITEKTITDWDNLKSELATIKSRGYAIDAEEELEGRACIAVPIFDPYGYIMASMSLSGHTGSIFEYPVNAIVRELENVAKLAVE